MPSLYESFGMSMLEAMVLGTPVIATNTVGACCLTNNGEFGVLTDNSDIGFTEGIRSCLENKERLHQYAEKAYMHALSYDRKHFDAHTRSLFENNK